MVEWLVVRINLYMVSTLPGIHGGTWRAYPTRNTINIVPKDWDLGSGQLNLMLHMEARHHH